MARKPRDYDAELRDLMERAKRIKSAKTVQLGELVQVIGADALPIETLAGALIAVVEQSRKQPEALARWAERGRAFFQDGGIIKRGKGTKGGTRGKDASGNPAPGAPGDHQSAPAADRAAE